MQVEAAEPRRIQDGLGQEQAIGHDDRGIEIERRERRLLAPRLSATAACAPASLARSANLWTGDGSSAMPRPLGRGGWE